jgi:hypothetical protein
MLAERVALALLVWQAFSALASPVEPFTVQDSTAHVFSDDVCSDRESVTQLESAATPQVYLDDGIFTGLTKGETDQFLGIPFAHPPCVLALSPFRRSFETALYAGLVTCVCVSRSRFRHMKASITLRSLESLVLSNP